MRKLYYNELLGFDYYFAWNDFKAVAKRLLSTARKKYKNRYWQKSQCFFNMQIKSSTKGLIDKKYLIVDDLQQIFDIRLKDSIFYGYSKKLVIKDYDKLLKYRYIPFGKPSKIKISNRNIFFDNCTINNIADYLQGFYNERIICNEKDTNRYSFSISNDILKLNRDLNIVGLNFDSVYSSDTLYIFYSIKGI